MILNSEQTKYINCDENSLVIACPGSGKTRSISAKAVNLLGRLKSKKSKIAVITYTNRAADEVYERIYAATDSTECIWVGTIHSFCLEWILRGFQNEIKELQNGFAIADEFVVKEIISELKKKRSIGIYDEINLKFGNDGKLLETDANKIALIQEYHAELKKRKLIDYEQILLICYKFLQGSKMASILLARVFEWVIVDEYQDTQPLQYKIIQFLSESNDALKVSFVGDPDQAIFKSLGSAAYNKVEIEKIFNKKFEEHTFVGCYRSHQEIIDFFSIFQTKDVAIQSRTTEVYTPLIGINKSVERDDLFDDIAIILEVEAKRGVRDSDICIVAPQWDLLESLIKKFKTKYPDRRIDAPGLSPVYKNEDNIWYILAKLFLTDSSPSNLNRRRKWSREVLYLLNIHVSTFLDVRNEIHFLELVNKSKIKNDVATVYLEESFNNLVKILKIDVELYPKLKEQHQIFFKKTRERIEKWNIQDLLKVFKSYFYERDGIVFNVIHGIKGEEYRVVIASGFLKGKVPHWDAIINRKHEADDEAKKLIYVTCSRAKERLYIYSEKGHVTKKGVALENSPFIPEER